MLENLLLLSESTHGAIDAFENEPVKAIGLYPLYVHIQDDIFVNFAGAAADIAFASAPFMFPHSGPGMLK